LTKRQFLTRVRHDTLASRDFTATDGIHYHSLCLASFFARLAALFVEAHSIVNNPDRTICELTC
jgi:hypothetical protein